MNNLIVECPKGNSKIKQDSLGLFKKEYVDFFTDVLKSTIRTLNEEFEVETYFIGFEIEIKGEVNKLNVMREKGTLKKFNEFLILKDITNPAESSSNPIYDHLKGKVNLNIEDIEGTNPSKIDDVQLKLVEQEIIIPWIHHFLDQLNDPNYIYIIPDSIDFYLDMNQFIIGVTKLARNHAENYLNFSNDDEKNINLLYNSLSNFYSWMDMAREDAFIRFALESKLNKGENPTPEKLYKLQVHINDILRLVGKDILLSVVLNIIPTNDVDDDLFETINLISTLAYEGSALSGKLLFCKEESGYNEILRFNEDVEIYNYRGVRKLLEMTKNESYLLFNGNSIFGLGL